MTAIFLPILLIVGALGVILFLFGRHLPDIRKNLRDGKESVEVGGDELPVSPKANYISKPLDGRYASLIANFKKGMGRLKKLGMAGAIIILKGAKFAGQATLKVFHRVPRLPDQLRRKEKAEVIIAEDVKQAADTADIKPVVGHPLRYPEPAVEIKNKPVQGKKIEEKIIEEFAKEEPEKIEEKIQEVIEKAEEKRVMTIEETEFAPAKKQRRFVGKIKPKAPVTPPPASPKVPYVDSEIATVTDEIQDIGKLIQENKLNAAESELIDVLSKNPRNTEAYRLLGIVYLKRNDYSQAREVFEEALRRDPEHGGLHGPLGFCYVSAGEYGKALSMYQQAHNEDDTNLEYLEQLLMISSRMDRRPLVKMVAKKILAINPSHAEAKKFLERVAAR